MKNNTFTIIRIFLLILVAILLTGVLVFALNGKFYKSMKSEVIYDHSYSAKSINNIKINTSSADISVINTDDSNIKIVAYGGNNSKVDVNLDNNMLDIDFKNEGFCVGICFYGNKLDVYVPKVYKNDFNINTKSGDITLDNYRANFNIKSTSGDIKASDLNILNVSVTSGCVDAGNVKKASVSSNSGDISINKSDYSNIKTTSGQISLERASNYVNLQSVSGDIKIEKLNLNQNSKISVTSSDVVINDINDIYVSAKTTSGDSHINKTNRYSKIELKISTTSGDVYVK